MFTEDPGAFSKYFGKKTQVSIWEQYYIVIHAGC